MGENLIESAITRRSADELKLKKVDAAGSQIRQIGILFWGFFRRINLLWFPFAQRTLELMSNSIKRVLACLSTDGGAEGLSR